jgi:hypothetical protein
MPSLKKGKALAHLLTDKLYKFKNNESHKSALEKSYTLNREDEKLIQDIGSRT